MVREPEGLRREWLFDTIQRVQGIAAHVLSQAFDLPETIERLLHEVQPPQGPLERMWLSTLIDQAAFELAFGWERQFGYRSSHRDFIVNDLPAIRLSIHGTHSARARKTEPSPTRRIYARRVRDHIDVHYAEPSQLRMISQQTGVSVRALTRKFHAVHGFTVHKYVIRRRLLAAIDLLRESDLKISAIAVAVGFRSRSSLHRHFIRLVGASATSVRNDRIVADKGYQRLTDGADAGSRREQA